MNVENLCKVFENFKNDNNRAILVDGPWGVGKTYQILKFLKKDASKKSKKTKIVYVSLFGKTTIDEIHTDIYLRLHPVKNGAKKVVRIIPKVAPLFGTVGNIISGMEFSLKTNEQENVSFGENIEKVVQDVQKLVDNIDDAITDEVTIKKVKNKTIIIFDDLERIDTEEISYIDILGYINNFFLQNIKVIAICNSKEIKDVEFKSFKEKVFDREYKISSTDNQIISSYFGEYSDLLKDYITDEFNKNLRIAHRVSVFFKEVIEKLSEYNEKYFEKISNETLLFNCALVVNSCNSEKYAIASLAPDAKKHLMFISLDDENIKNISQNICDYLKNKNSGTRIFENLIIGLLEVYYYNTFDRLIPIFIDKNDLEDPFMENPFYLSDDEKIDLFSKQFSKIQDDSIITNRNLSSIIISMCKYVQFSDIDNRENIIIDNILAKCEQKELYHLMDFPFVGCNRFQMFCQKLTEEYNKKQINILVNSINDFYKNAEYSKLYNCLRDLGGSEIYAPQGNLDNYIKKAIESNNFFIDDLFATIDEAKWDVVLIMCDISKKYSFDDLVVNYIRTIDYKNDISAKERYEFLLKNKLESNK